MLFTKSIVHLNYIESNKLIELFIRLCCKNVPDTIPCWGLLMLFILLPSLQFTDDISSKHTHLFQIRGKDITKRYERCEDADSVLAEYKQHYDYLRHLVPTDPKRIELKEARISYYKDESGIYLDAYPLEGDRWEDSLSKKLVIEDDVIECNAEIAACCMWHMSFYGYLPYQQDECFDDMFDGIEKKKKMRVKFYRTKFADVIPSGKKAS